MHTQATAAKLDFLGWEMGMFFHFGIRSFNEGHRDWDGKAMELSSFNPTELDCGQWVRTAQAMGAKYAVLVCKHHDGFANWPTKYSEYSVAHTPWKDGKGDVVREFVDACRAGGLKVGLYYSPAEAGYKNRTAREHDDYFIAQIGELLTDYGTIDYLWFDGCGSEGHEYDKPRIIAAIRDLQPNILIFNMWDPDTRWIGNEAGIAPIDHTNRIKELDVSVMTQDKEALDAAYFLPGECDCMLRRRNWFYSEYDVGTVKSVEELLGMYHMSVGRGANLLINVGPDRRGLLPDVDAQRLAEFGQAVRERFAHPMAATVSPCENGIEIDLAEEALVDCLVLEEDLADGEHIDEYAIYAQSWIVRSVKIAEGKHIGHKRIVEFPPIRAKRFVVEVTRSDGAFKLLGAKAYKLH